ncbi:hypothetical protein EDB80DRAFT_759935 [Ilyonectria destructans]|nr:hypothetical protein EDB80DRAFT_759935 [Ilyonectria destructans]
MTYQKFFSHRVPCERSTADKILILVCCSRLLRYDHSEEDYREEDYSEEDYSQGDYSEDDYPGDDRPILEPANLDEIRQNILAPRASISLSQTRKSVFSKFKRRNRAASARTVMSRVIPIIDGNANFLNGQDVLFTNLISMTNQETVTLMPDYFDGAPIRAIHEKVKHDLSTVIIPTHDEEIPVAANLFLEAKSLIKNSPAGKRQACIAGANGSRAMQALQSYGEAELIYDNNAYAFSATYQAGDSLLQLYAHHATPPTKTDGKPNYHMTLLNAFILRVKPQMHLAEKASNAEQVAAKESLGTAAEMKQPEELDYNEDVEAQEAHDTTNADDAVSPADKADQGSPTHFDSPDDEQQGRSPARSCKRKRTPASSKQVDRASKIRKSLKRQGC